MSCQTKDGWTLFWAGNVAGLVLGFAIGGLVCESWLHSQAVEQGFAEYNRATGEWQWKPITKETERE